MTMLTEHTTDPTGSDTSSQHPARAADTAMTTTSGITGLLPFARHARGRFAVAALLATLAALASLVPFWAIYRCVDEVVTAGASGASRSVLWIYALVALVALVARFALFGTATYLSHLAAYRALYEMRIDVAEHLAEVPLGYVTGRRSGEIKKVIGDDIERLEMFLAHGLPDIVAAIVTSVVVAVWMLVIDWRMAIAALVVLAPALWAMSAAMRRSSRHTQEYQRTLGEMNATITELIAGMPVVKVFNRGTDEVRGASQAIDEHVRTVRRYSLDFLPLGTAFFVLIGANVAVLVPLGVWLHTRGSLSTSDLLFFFIVGLGALGPVQSLLYLFSGLAHLSSGGNMVRNILATPPLTTGTPAAVPADASIELRDVTFGYGDPHDRDRAVLHDVSLRVEPGTVCALVGPSGAGKSTIAALVARFWDVSDGAVLVGGADVRDIAPDDLSRHVAVVLQDTFLFDDTVAGNLRVAKPDATDAELVAACQAAQAHDFVAALSQGYETPVGEHGARLSGGERQRLTIARAILAGAPVVVLDEATAFTDPENEAAIREAIGTLMEGRTVLMIAHRLSTVIGADQIVVVDDGHIVESGTHGDLVAAGGAYAQLWSDFTATTGVAERDTPPTDDIDAATRAISATAELAAGLTTGDLHTADATTATEPQFEPRTQAPTSTATAGLRSGGVIRTTWALAGDQRATLARSIGWKVAQSVCQAIPVAVLVVIIDRVRQGTLDTSVLGWAMPVILACVVGQWGFGYLANRSAWIATFEMFGRIRIQLLDHLRRLPMGFHTSHRAGDTLTAATQDIAAVETFVHEPMQAMIGAVVGPIAVFVLLASVDWRMAMVTMASVAIAYPTFVVANRVFKALAAERQRLQGEASGRMVEYVQGLPVIRAFRLSGDKLERFRQALDDYRRVNTALVVKLTPLGMLLGAVVMLGIPLVLFVGGTWLTGDTIDAGTFLIFAVLVLRVYQPLLGALDGAESLRIADASLDRIAAVLDAPLYPETDEAGPGPATFDVTFDDVTFTHDGAATPTLVGVSFTASPGSTTALVGPSGAGKTTALNMVARFHDPERGAVRIGGIDVRRLTAEQLFEAVTVVFQDVYLFPGTIRDNIAFGRPGTTDTDVEAAARAARAHDFITALPLGYDTPVGEAGATLSGGERQRISIARAIVKDAPIVLLDEATAAIDPTNERHVQAALAELARDKTVIVVAHRLSTIRAADMILAMDAGRVVERGTHDELLAADGLYTRFWAARRAAETWSITH